MEFLVIFCFSICVIDFIKNRNYFSPLFIFNFIWALTLGLYQMKISYLQHDLSERTIFIFYICVIAYNLAVILCKYMKLDRLKIKRKKNISNNKIINPSRKIEYKIKIARNIALIVFVIEIIYSKGLPIIWKIIGSSKIYFDFGIPSINGAWYGLIIFLGAYSFANKTKDKYLYLCIGILIISRQIIMSILIEAVIYMIIQKEIKIDKKKIVLLIIIVIVGFSILGNFRSGSSTMDEIFFAKEKYENMPTALKWIYSYMTFSITNIDNLINLTPGAVNHGASMLYDIIPTVLLNLVNIKVNYSPYYLEFINFNVSTYLPSIYLDFGVFGVFIFNFIIGFIGARIFHDVQKDNFKRDILLYCVFVHNIILLFFINMFLYLPIIVQFIYIYIVFKDERKEENSENFCNHTSL